MRRNTKEELREISYKGHVIGFYQYRDWDAKWVSDCTIDGEFSQCEGVANRGNLTIAEAKKIIDEIVKEEAQ